jgi:hypothetical protein
VQRTAVLPALTVSRSDGKRALRSAWNGRDRGSMSRGWRGVKRRRFTESEAPRALRSVWRRGSLGSRCSRLFGAFGGRVLGDEVLGPFGVASTAVSGRRRSEALRGSECRGFGAEVLESFGRPVPRLSSRGVGGSIGSLVSWASWSHGVAGGRDGPRRGSFGIRRADRLRRAAATWLKQSRIREGSKSSGRLVVSETRSPDSGL